MKKQLLFWAGLAFAASTMAQLPCNLRLEGHLLYSDDSSYAENAEVFIENIHLKSRTDKHGYFQLKKICAGNILLEIDLGDQTHIHHFMDIYRDTTVIIYIEKPAMLMNTASITTKKSTTQILGAEQLLQNAGDNLATQLERLNGVQTIKTGGTIGKPISEGMTGLRLPIYVNGIKQESQQWGAEHGPELDALGYSKITLLSGANILTRSHDALGGIVEITGNKEAHNGELDLTTGTGFGSNGRLWSAYTRATGKPYGKRGTWYSNISAKQSGNYRSPDYYLLNTASKEAAMITGIIHAGKNATRALDLSFYSNVSGIYSGSSIGSVADLEAAIQRTQPLYGEGNFSYSINPPRQSVSHAQLRYEESKSNSRFLVALQYDNRREFDHHRSSINKFPQLDLYQSNLSVKKDHNTAFLKNKHVQWGWSSSQTLNRYGGYYFIPDFISNSSGIYGLAQFKRGPFQFYFSLRGDAKILHAEWNEKGSPVSDTRTFGNISAAAEALHYGRKGRMIFNLMRLWRAPWVNELYSKGVHHGSAAFESGNITLKTEHDYKSQLEYFIETKRIHFYVKGYLHYIHNFINLSPDSSPVITVRGAFPSYSYRQFDALFTGTDAELKFPVIKPIEIMLRASVTFGKDLKNKVFPAYLPLPTASGVLNYHRKNFTFYLQVQHTWKQPFYTEGSDYLPPPVAYTLLHCGIQVKNMFKGQHFSAFLDVNNAFNTAYRNYLDRFRYYADMPGRNIQVRIQYNFHHHNEKIK